MVVVVNPGRRDVTLYRPASEAVVLTESDELDRGEVVPGFRCKVSDVFV